MGEIGARDGLLVASWLGEPNGGTGGKWIDSWSPLFVRLFVCLLICFFVCLFGVFHDFLLSDESCFLMDFAQEVRKSPLENPKK